jgi:hypothetical protein
VVRWLSDARPELDLGPESVFLGQDELGVAEQESLGGPVTQLFGRPTCHKSGRRPDEARRSGLSDAVSPRPLAVPNRVEALHQAQRYSEVPLIRLARRPET